MTGESQAVNNRRAWLISLLFTFLRGVIGAAAAIVLLILLLALFYTLFVDLSSGEGLRTRPYGDAVLTLFWLLAALAGGFSAAWRARRRYAAALITGILLILLFDLARQMILPARDLSAPTPGMVYWIFLLLVPGSLAGAYLAPPRT